MCWLTLSRFKAEFYACRYAQPMISVVVPTCNRPDDLKLVLKSIKEQDVKVEEIIIVDSSDFKIDLPKLGFDEILFQHVKVNIKSAAVQRNIGMDLVNPNSSYLCFLDDDVTPDSNYLSRLIDGLRQSGGIGISGIAVNPLKRDKMRLPPSGLFGFMQRLFLLDSNCDGKLLRSGVNIPVRKDSGVITKVDWLIGCSVWDFTKVKSLRFESDFMGVSLSEDVIFSLRASTHGDLFVDPEVHLWHSESDIGREKGAKFWEMWVVNRRRLVEISAKSYPHFIQFHLANLGQLLSLIYSGVKGKRLRQRIYLGIVMGYRTLYLPKKKKK
jgi:GT2 family glycosyltransferase